jgi:hypothetical protein
MEPTLVTKEAGSLPRHTVNGGDYEYNTHQPFLCYAAANTTGNILECGMGHTSTLLLKSYLKGTSRKLISLESNKDWFEKFSIYQDENFEGHLLNLGEEDTVEIAMEWIKYIVENIDEKSIDFVFLDQVPFMAREFVLNHFKDKVKFIVLHDADYFASSGRFGNHTGTNEINGNKLNMCDFSSEFKNHIFNHPPLPLFIYWSGPPTLFLSNTLTNEEWAEHKGKLDVYLENLYKEYA